jgi:hypothetical protein
MNRKNKKGASLLLTILIMSAILAIAMGIAKLSFGEIKISLALPQSFIAYYAAEAGTEQALYADLITAIPHGTASNFSGTMGTGITYDVTFSGTSPGRVIKSTGTYSGTSRAIQTTY